MDLRGPAAAVTCPRCDTDAIPGPGPLVTCARCKLTFDANPDRQVRTRRPPPSREPVALVATPRSTVEIVRERGELAIHLGSPRLSGALSLAIVLMVGRLLATIPVDATTIVFWGVLVVWGYTGLAKLVGGRVIRVRAGQLTSTQGLLPLPPWTSVPLSQIESFELVEGQSRGLTVIAGLHGGGAREVACFDGRIDQVQADAELVATTLADEVATRR